MSRPRLYIRKFLNKPGFHAAAHVFIKVEDTRTVRDAEHPTSVSFRMTDCFDSISLDFDMETAPQRRNSLYKARVLRDAMARLVVALEAEVALADTRGERRAS